MCIRDSPKWSAKWLSTHQSSYASARVNGSFPAWFPRWDSPVGSNLESLRATQSSQWTRSHSVCSAWRSHTEKRGLSWQKRRNFVIFRYISTKLGDKVYIWLFDSHVKFDAKICTHGWNINKSHRRATFLCSPCRCMDWTCALIMHITYRAWLPNVHVHSRPHHRRGPTTIWQTWKIVIDTF